jgi:hypothetical protein
MRGWWTEDGPTSKAFSKEKRRISEGEAVMLWTCLGLWNSHEHKDARLADIVGVLDENNLEAIGSLLVAMSRGSAADIDGWLEKHPRPEPALRAVMR